jgi:ABC-type phosphate transport system substrate-binding protein
VAFSLFTLVVNEDAGVRDLSLDQIRRIYAGEFTRWSDPELGGNDVPIRLVSRHNNSGTAQTFRDQILGGTWEARDNSEDCLERDFGDGVVRCRRDSTTDVLTTVAQTGGALGYSELGSAADRDDLVLVRIGGQEATLDAADHGVYPFWETEYAYTYGELRARSLAASFLRYLTNQVGRDIIRERGHRPCIELANPLACQPPS